MAEKYNWTLEFAWYEGSGELKFTSESYLKPVTSTRVVAQGISDMVQHVVYWVMKDSSGTIVFHSSATPRDFTVDQVFDDADKFTQLKVDTTRRYFTQSYIDSIDLGKN